jgi:hypothetical protein
MEFNQLKDTHLKGAQLFCSDKRSRLSIQIIQIMIKLLKLIFDVII